MATKVSLRQKKISKGRKSLYLDFYPAIKDPKTGKLSRREFLNMYIFIDKKDLKNEINRKKVKGKDVQSLEEVYAELKPLNPIQKRHNEETLKIAESIRQKRQNILDKPEIYSDYEKEQLRIKELGEQSFIEYFEKLANKRKGSNNANWMATLNYLKSFRKEEIKFSDLNESLLEDFKEYLLTTSSNRSEESTLSRNSASAYFNKVKAALKQAYIDGYLQINLNSKVKPIKQGDTRREYLTMDELNKLVKEECRDPLIKKAALFSALTGMAFKEIQNLVWKDIQMNDKGEYLVLTKRQKTQRDNYLPISNQAYELLEGQMNPKDMPQDQKVFKGLTYSAYQNKHLYQWIGAAGITKNITFHCFRHTYATLQLFNGTDIYTVSKMLGHKYLKTTQIYAKIVDEAKRVAANKIQLDI